MSEATLTPARERHVARGRSNGITRLVAAVDLALEGAPVDNALIALNEVLQARLGKSSRTVYVTRERQGLHRSTV